MRALNDGGDPAPEPIRWRLSRALGKPNAGRLAAGVRLPAEGAAFFTWDPVHNTTPNRAWRRHGTDRLVQTLLDVLGDYQDDHPDAPRVGIGDLSRPHGGDFGPRFGAPGHASHQNGLDADVYYPRLDRRERGPARPAQVDRALAQDLVDRFVAAGAQFVFVGYRVGLRGPRRVVQPIPLHENHLHVRLGPGRER
jgi:murein endopeptidase